MALSSTSAASPLFDADIPTLIAAWEGSARDFLEVAEGLDDTEWSYATSCPGWTVGDIVAHVAGVDRDLAGDAPPTDEPDWEALPHVNRPFSRFRPARHQHPAVVWLRPAAPPALTSSNPWRT